MKSRFLRKTAGPAVVVLAVVLAGCGGGGSSSTTATTYALTSAQAVLGQADFVTGTPNGAGGVVGATTVDQPLGGIATDGTDFYIPDLGNNRILGFGSVPTTTNASALFALGQSSLQTGAAGLGPTALAYPGSAWVGGGMLVVADSNNNRVLIWNSLPTSASTPPNVVVGQSNLTSNLAGTTQTALNYPTDAAIAGGKLVVVDQNNNRVLIWNSVPTADDAPASIVLGQPNFTSNTPNIVSESATTLDQPSGVWTDGYRLLVSDSGNDRVLYWTSMPVTPDAAASYVIGQASFTYSSTTVSSQTMNNPTGLSSDGAKLFVADTGNNRVLIYNSIPIANDVAADAVLGQENFTHNVANDDNGDATDPQTGTALTHPTRRTLDQPTGVGYADDRLYVTDRGNNRIMVFSEAP